MKSSSSSDLLKFMLIPTKFRLSPNRANRGANRANRGANGTNRTIKWRQGVGGDSHTPRDKCMILRLMMFRCVSPRVSVSRAECYSSGW